MEPATQTATANKPAPTAEPAAEPPRNAIDLFNRRVALSGDAVALKRKVHGVWKPSTWRDWDKAAREIAGGLRGLGVGLGDRVVLLANTRPEWVECDVGILMAGAVTVPIYPSSTPEQCEYIITDSGAKVVIVEDPHQLEKLLEPAVRAKLAGVAALVLMTDVAALERPDGKGRVAPRLDEVLPADAAERSRLRPLADLRQAGGTWLNLNPGVLEAAWAAVEPDHVFTIVYTSGTTGPPKGVVLTHKNIVFEATGVGGLLGLGSDDEQVLFLPLAHIFAKILEWAAIHLGCTTSFAESVPKLIQNLQEVRPTFMGAVPRVYEKAYAKIQANFEDKRKKALPRMLINWALGVGKRRSEREQKGEKVSGLSYRMADKLVFDKVKATFGGRLRFFISGGAPLSREIAEFFHQAGLLILEGYGLTETTAATHVNRPGDFKFGTVGPALPGMEVKIAADGEILVRGGNIMKEYFGKPEATAEVLEQDGWFHTGDIGVIEPTGHLRITDRKKDIIVTAGGKNVAPQNLEGALKAQCPFVSQVMVHGDKRKFLSALITLNEEAVTAWAVAQGLEVGSPAELARHPRVRALIQGALDHLNAELAQYETIKKFEILERDFDQATGELTPTLKVKRKFVTEKFRALLDGFYTGKDGDA